jgi:hypothetical protein
MAAAASKHNLNEGASSAQRAKISMRKWRGWRNSAAAAAIERRQYYRMAKWRLIGVIMALASGENSGEGMAAYIGRRHGGGEGIKMLLPRGGGKQSWRHRQRVPLAKNN